MLEYEKFQELQAKSQRMQEDYEHQLSEMEHQKRQALQEQTEYYEVKLHELTSRLEQARYIGIKAYSSLCFSCSIWLLFGLYPPRSELVG